MAKRYVTVSYGQTIGQPGYSSERVDISLDIPVTDEASTIDCLKTAEKAHTKVVSLVQHLTGKSFE